MSLLCEDLRHCRSDREPKRTAHGTHDHALCLGVSYRHSYYFISHPVTDDLAQYVPNGKSNHVSHHTTHDHEPDHGDSIVLCHALQSAAAATGM